MAAQVWQQLITGTVTDSAGQPLPMVLVRVPGTWFATRTNTDGGFSFDSLPAGYLTIRAESIGYRPEQRDSVLVESGRPMVLNFRLRDNPLRPLFLARQLAPALKTSPACYVEAPVEPVTDTVPGTRPVVVVIASCRDGSGMTRGGEAHFAFARSGHLVVRDHRGWERLLQRYWHPDSTGAVPITEPDWRGESLLFLSLHASGGCGWTYYLHVAAGDSTSVTLELLSDHVAPCQLLVREVYLLRVTEPNVQIRVRERAELGPVGVAERLPL